MADPVDSEFSDGPAAASEAEGPDEAEQARLVENLIDLLAENLEPPIAPESEGNGSGDRAPNEPLKSAAVPPSLSDTATKTKVPPPPPPPPPLPIAAAEDPSPPRAPSPKMAAQEPPSDLKEPPANLSVVVENQAQRSPTPPPKSRSGSPPRPGILPSQRSKALVARSATAQSHLSNTTERLLHLQLRVLNTLLKLQVSPASEEAPPAPVAEEPPKSSWVDRIWTQFRLGIMVALVALAGLGAHHWLTSGDRQLQQRLSDAFTADPELAVYRVQPRLEDGAVVLSGRVPTAALQASATSIAQQAAPDRSVRNEVLVVQLPPDDAAVQQQVDQLLAIANESDTLRSRATVKDQIVTLEGVVESDQAADRLVARLKQVPGVATVQDQLQRQPRAIATRVYFYANAATVLPADLIHKLQPIRDQLKAHPDWTLSITGHQHANEQAPNTGQGNTLALQRAIAVRSHLEDLGIDRRRLDAAASPTPPPGTSATEAPWTQQVVLFELRSPPDAPKQ